MTTALELVHLIGVLSGITSITMAYWIQVISERKCDPIGPVALFLAGASMMMLMYLFIVDLTALEMVIIEIGAITVATLASFAATYYIWSNGEIESVSETISGMVVIDNDNAD